MRMEELRRLAFVSIGRACGFAGLAILCVMIGLTYDPLVAVRSGGILMTIATMVLLLKARGALSKDVRRTEMWIMLDEAKRPSAEYAQWAGATVLRDAYLWFAQYAAGLSIVLWSVALILSLSQRF
jgi:type IV secretory pathway VirB3-like protein